MVLNTLMAEIANLSWFSMPITAGPSELLLLHGLGVGINNLRKPTFTLRNEVTTRPLLRKKIIGAEELRPYGIELNQESSIMYINEILLVSIHHTSTEPNFWNVLAVGRINATSYRQCEVFLNYNAKNRTGRIFFFRLDE